MDPQSHAMNGQKGGNQPRIDSYKFGYIVIDGRAYTSDVIILPTGIKPNWWREDGHLLKPVDLGSVLEAKPKYLIIGQGAYARMQVSWEVLACLKEAGIKPICLPTAKAVGAYNERAERGENVAAALHLTC